jgi:hypothetical protein
VVAARDGPNENIKCPGEACSANFKTFRAFKRHLVEAHGNDPNVTQSMSPSTDAMDVLSIADMDTASPISEFTEPPPPHQPTASSSEIKVMSRDRDHSSSVPDKKSHRYHPYAKPSRSPSWSPEPSSSFNPTTTPSQESQLVHNVSDTLVTLDGSVSYLKSNPIFDYMGLRYHTLFKVLICICGRAVMADSAYGHVKNHGVEMKLEQLREMHKVLDSLDLIMNARQLATPVNGGPPVELLTQVPRGHCCDFCGYCAPSRKSMDNHWSRVHKLNRKIARQHRCHLGTLQTFFYPVSEHYFEVNPMLGGQPKDSLFAIYMRDEVPKIPAFPATAPQDSRDVNPLLKSTEWHVHLEGHTADRRTRETLRSLVQLPSSQAKTGLSSLGRICNQYLVLMRDKAMSSSFAMRCLLMECPRWVVSNK